MYSKTLSASLSGIEAQIINIEIDSSQGVPAFHIVGLADKAINESKDRISAAMRASGFEIAPKKITVNLSPANQKKEGSHLDLAIATNLLVNFGYIDIDQEYLNTCVFFGELGLNGSTKSSTGLLALLIESKRLEIQNIIIPKNIIDKASIVNNSSGANSRIFTIEDLNECKELLELLFQEQKLRLINNHNETQKQLLSQYEKKISEFLIKKSSSKFTDVKRQELLLDDVIGQNQAKRGLEIAAAGKHHVLMIGPPGCGKSMLASRFKYLLPELSMDEYLELVKIYSCAGINEDLLSFHPPFRSPHHTASNVALIGGSSNVKPGEVTLAHNGVLFLDELTEFSRCAIEQLRQVLENKEITINRIKNTYTFPANFILVAACNPCPCGYMGDKIQECSCSPSQVNNYFGKLSGPLLDRIDMHIEVSRLNKDEISLISKQGKNKNASNEKIRSKILEAKNFSQSTKNKKFSLPKNSMDFIDNAVYNLGLSARGTNKLIKVARTIADLDFSEQIEIQHLGEALQYRSLNLEKYKR